MRDGHGGKSTNDKEGNYFLPPIKDGHVGKPTNGKEGNYFLYSVRDTGENRPMTKRPRGELFFASNEGWTLRYTL
jgi:hypothetical protein